MKKRIISLITVMMMALSVFVIGTDDVSAASDMYWLKVNRTANVVNVYKMTGGQWQPYKVMLCSCGKNKKGSRTPTGNYSIKKKWRWQKLFHGVSGQYVSQFKGNYLFHSVVYKKKGKGNTCLRSEYNKLGKNASHGCVRLATMDARWIYENCSKGTKVTVYAGSTAGPLGKPGRVAMKGTKKKFWDPTDSISSNKYFNMKGPVIYISKAATAEYGSSFSIKSGVTAKSPYTFENLTSAVAVHSVTYCAQGSSTYAVVPGKTVSTSKPGKYKITYKCYNKYCGKNTVYRTFILTVKPKPEPQPESAPQPQPEPVPQPQPEPAPEPQPEVGPAPTDEQGGVS